MVSTVVSKMGMTELIFVDPGMKVNAQYYHDVLLSQQMCASDQACCRRYVCLSTRQCSHAKDTIKLLQQARQTSLVLISGHQTAQTWIYWIIRCGVLCSRECVNVIRTVSMSWSSASLKSRTVWHGHQWVEKATERACVQMDNILNLNIVSTCNWQIRYK